ncbi:hypothetical protein F4804DRAFT_305677 [Jackrogersella minutella]|nr:hypothetical protein F4804DRAFT_305677 [Jackrogersella minutella]
MRSYHSDVQSKGDRPIHDCLELLTMLGIEYSFRDGRLFKTRNPDANPILFHLGSGDSVCTSCK